MAITIIAIGFVLFFAGIVFTIILPDSTSRNKRNFKEFVEEFSNKNIEIFDKLSDKYFKLIDSELVMSVEDAEKFNEIYKRCAKSVSRMITIFENRVEREGASYFKIKAMKKEVEGMQKDLNSLETCIRIMTRELNRGKK